MEKGAPVQLSGGLKLTVATFLCVIAAVILSYGLTLLLVLFSFFLDEGVRHLGSDWADMGVYTVPAAAGTAPFCAWVYYGIRKRSRSLAPYAGLGMAFLWAVVLNLMIGDMHNFDDQFNWAVNSVVGMVFLTDVLVLAGFAAFTRRTRGHGHGRHRRHRTSASNRPLV